MKQVVKFAAVGFLALALAGPAVAADYDYDVVVYGGTSGGVAAAVQAARMGKKVALVEPGVYVGDGTYVSHLGGLTSGGLGATDVGDSQLIAGFSADFYRREDRAGGGSGYDVHAGKAEQVYDAMVREAGVDVYRNQRLNRDTGVTKSGSSIRSITTLGGDTFRAGAFVDGTYEGDLMAAAGVSYAVGREDRSTYSETYNGIAYDQTREHVFGGTDVSPYKTPGDTGSGLVDGVHLSSRDPRGNGAADGRIQAYCYRMTWTQDSSRTKWSDLWGTNGENPPEGYDRDRYELHDRYLNAGHSLGDVVRLDTGIGGGKNDINNWGPVSTDFIGGNYDVYVPSTGRTVNYAEANYQEREYIIKKHIEYTKGFLYYLAFESPVQGAMNDWGLASDEFTDNENFPHQLYVREARRMLGAYVMTEAEARDQVDVPNPVGLGGYPMDSHNTHRFIDTDGYVEVEGNFWLGGIRETYEIDFGTITPKEGEADNLVVVSALSGSHTAFGSMRMEPVFMVLGQSGGTAIVRALEEGVAVQQIDFATYQAIMRQYGQVLTQSEPAAGPFQGTIREDFDYGPDAKNLEEVSYITPGFDGPWSADVDDPKHDPAAQLTYDDPVYVNSVSVGTSGGAADAAGASDVVGRTIAGDGIAGDEVWMSVLVKVDNATGEQTLIYLDNTGSDDALGVAEGGVLELFGTQGASGFADGEVHLLLALLSIGSGDDAVDLWIDPDLTGGEGGLSLADLSVSGSDMFGDYLNFVGLSVGGSGGMIDALRISNAEDAFDEVLVPEPATLALLAAGGAFVIWNRRKGRRLRK